VIDQAAGFLRDDLDGVREMLDEVARLVDDPRPAGSFPYGSPDRRRLRIGRYRSAAPWSRRFASRQDDAFPMLQTVSAGGLRAEGWLTGIIDGGPYGAADGESGG
jgi:hypothetical protein